jgi:THO complex subunit 5
MSMQAELQQLETLLQQFVNDKAHAQKTFNTACAHMASLRHLNRQQQLAIRSKRLELDAARSQLDDYALQLQNVNYERMHLLQEIRTCEQYESTYQTLALVDLEEFVENAPDDIKDTQGHELQMNRLLYELQQREELNKNVSALRVQRSQLVVKRQKRRDDLKKMDGMIVEHVNASKALAKQLGITTEELEALTLPEAEKKRHREHDEMELESTQS